MHRVAALPAYDIVQRQLPRCFVVLPAANPQGHRLFKPPVLGEHRRDMITPHPLFAGARGDVGTA